MKDEEGEFISIDIDTQNRAHFSYYDLSDQDLKIPFTLRG